MLKALLRQSIKRVFHEQSNECFFRHRRTCVEFTDKQAFQNWQAEQAAMDDDEQPMTEPAHPLDAPTLTAVLFLLIPPVGVTGKLTAGQVRFAVRRFFVLAANVIPEIGANGFTVMADAITQAGIPTTRACLSNIYTELAAITGNTALGKSANAREVYSQRAKKVWALKKSKQIS
jgi:hypothetical protein